MVAMVATGKEEYRAVQNMKFIQSRHHRNHPQQIKHPVVLPMVKIDMEEHPHGSGNAKLIPNKAQLVTVIGK